MRSTATTVVAWNIYPGVYVGEGIQVSYPLKPKGGDSAGEGSLDPSSQHDQVECASRGDTQGIGHCTQTPFLNPNPFL